jgi:hypothetical protein
MIDETESDGVLESPEPEVVEPVDVVDEVEVLDGVPMLAELRPLAPAQALSLPAMQAAAMTAGGFFAGALAMALVKRLAARRLGEIAPPLPDRFDSWPAGTSRTYLVNVRLITRPGE